MGQPTPVQEAAASLAPILRVAPRTMATRIHTAQTLAGLPRTAAMGWAGDLESYRINVITRAARQVGHEQLSEFEARLHHGDITDLPTSRVKTRARLIAARLMPDPDPADPEQDAPASGALREVRVGPADEAGLTKWDAVLPTDASVSMRAAMETLAAQYRADNPQLTVAQSRADALVDLVLSDVQVSTTATLIIPTTSAPAADPAVHPEPDETTTEPQTAAQPAPTATADLPTGPNPVPTAAPARPGATGPRRLTPPPGCDCGARSRSLVDLLAALDRPGVVLTGPWAADLPDPPLQQHAQTKVHQAIEVDANPHLARDWHGRVWFVPKPVTSPPVGLLLPAQVSAILADPDTIIRLGRSQPAHRRRRAAGRADLPTRRQAGPAGARPGWHLQVPGLRHPRGTVRPGPRHRLPGRSHVGGQPAESLPGASRVQAPRRLDRHHDPRRRVHLDRPQRTQPHHPPPQPARRRRLTRTGPRPVGSRRLEGRPSHLPRRA